MAKAYEEQATAILGNKTLDPWYKRILLKRLDEEFGEDVPETGKTAPAPAPDSAGKPNNSPFLAGLHGLGGSRDKKNPIMTLPYFIPKNHRKPSPEDIYLPPGKYDPPAQIDKSSMLLDARMISDTPSDSFRDELLGLRNQNKAVPLPDAVGGSTGTAGTGFLQGLATGDAGGPEESKAAGNQATQSVVHDNTTGDFSAADHRQEQPSPFVQGLQGTNDGNTPRPTPSPTPMPTQTPAILEPMPGPGPLTDPADIPYGGTYEEQSRAIANSEMDPWEKNFMQDQLDIVFGKSQPAAKVQSQLEIDNATKLKTKVDRINALKKQLKELDGIASAPEGWKNSIREQIKNEIKQFGKGLTGLDGDILDPASIVDIKLNNKDIGNARYENGVATGNLDDIVKGLGGRIVWDGRKNATVYDADGKVVSNILNTAQGFMECDKDGRIIKKCGMRGGSVQADVVEYAEKMGVPYSKFHDRNGVFHLNIQTDMKDSPVKMVRNEKDVTLYLYMDYEGKYADQIFPGTEQKDANGNIIPNTGYTYAELVALGVKERWKDGQKFNIGGKIKIPDSNGPYTESDGTKYRLEYADPNDTVTLHVKIFSNNPSGNAGIWEKPMDANQKMGKTKIIDPQWGFRSHDFTLDIVAAWEDFKSGKMSWKEADAFIKELRKNLGDVADSGQLERALYNWSLEDPGTLFVYVGPKNPYISDAQAAEDFKSLGAHETVHAFGEGDAYQDKLFRPKESPEVIELVNSYGEKMFFDIKKFDPNDPLKNDPSKADLMFGGKDFSETDLVMMMNALETGAPQFFPKGDDSITENIKKNRWEAIIDYINRHVIDTRDYVDLPDLPTDLPDWINNWPGDK